LQWTPGRGATWAKPAWGEAKHFLPPELAERQALTGTACKSRKYVYECVCVCVCV